MNPTLSKDELLNQITHEHAIWSQVVADVGTEHMLEPYAADDWTFKDVVAHLVGWRRLTLERLHAAQQSRAAPAAVWPQELTEDDNLDEINAWFQQSARDRSLADVLAEYDRSFGEMHAATSAIAESDLLTPGRYEWLHSSPLAAVLTGTFEHFHEDHEPHIRAWLGQRGASRS